MRSTLFEVPLTWPLFGPGILLAIWAVYGFVLIRRARIPPRPDGQASSPLDKSLLWGMWIAGAVTLLVLPLLAGKLLPRAVPIFGFGTMIFLAFVSSVTLAAYRLRRNGFDPEIAWDFVIYALISGIAGARAFFVIQYWEQFENQPWTRIFWLSDGGLVFYGGLIAGVAVFYFYCSVRNLNPLAVGDVLITSVFLGMGIGRLGCLLPGCCFGDYCELPWAIQFPANSPPFLDQVNNGLIPATAAFSLPVHPTQVYSAIDGLLLATITWAYYPYRRRAGDVVLIGWIASPATRFLLEVIRNDERGQFGTTLTISQWVSIGLIVSAVGFWVLRDFVWQAAPRQLTNSAGQPSA